MEEFLFAAFMSQNQVRIGRTKSLANRIEIIRSEANAIGADIHSLLITSPMENAQGMELAMMQIMATRFDRVSLKTFVYRDQSDVKEVFSQLRLEYMHVLDVKTLKVGMSYRVCALLNYQDYDDINSAEKKTDANLSAAKVIDLMSANGGTITHGVLRNKLRHLSDTAIDETIKWMVTDGIIKTKKSTHKYNKVITKRYTLAK